MKAQGGATTLTDVKARPTPDYATLRDRAPFRWGAHSTVHALLELTATPLGAYNLDPAVGIDVYRRGWPLFREVFPDAKTVALPSVHTPHISYGHVNGLGSELLFPERGEVGQTHIYASLEEGIRALGRPVNFAEAGMAPFYLEYRRRLQAAFPDHKVGFVYGLEGPLTTAYELRGEGIFYDLMDQPEQVRKFLRLTTDSILAFWSTFLAVERGVAVIDPQIAGLADDIAAMVPARMFDEFVLPFWEQYYQARTTGTRSAHVEDLRPEQLPFLERVGLSYYDPSISPKLTPQLIRDGCRVPFTWRLGSFHYRAMTCADVTDWVFRSVADGATGVITMVDHVLCRPENVPKINAFIAASQEVERVFKAGGSREEIRRLASPSARRRASLYRPQA